MNQNVELNECDPLVCESCEPKLALSLEEESILKEMRKVKDEARLVSDELDLSDSHDGKDSRELINKLHELKESWLSLKERLDGANKRKLINLGHL